MAPLEQTFPLGTSTPSALRVASAYGTFAADYMTGALPAFPDSGVADS